MVEKTDNLHKEDLNKNSFEIKIYKRYQAMHESSLS